MILMYFRLVEAICTNPVVLHLKQKERYHFILPHHDSHPRYITKAKQPADPATLMLASSSAQASNPPKRALQRIDWLENSMCQEGRDLILVASGEDDHQLLLSEEDLLKDCVSK